MMRRLVLAAALWLLPTLALAANCSSNPFTLVNGQTADATQVMANFNNLLNCANNNLAHNAANSDITSLSGLTTPISIIQGGTGLTTFTANGLLVGNGTGTPTFLVPSTNGNLPQSVSGAWLSTNVWPSLLPTKTTPLTADSIVLMDSAAGNAAKTSTLSALQGVIGQLVVIFQDRYSTGTAGAALTNNAFTDRPLTTILLNTLVSGVSLSNPTLTLPAGTYDVRASIAGANVGLASSPHRTILFNVTTSGQQSDVNGNLIVSDNCFTDSVNNASVFCSLRDRFTISGSTQFKFQTFVTNTNQVTGVASGLGEPEIYLTAEFVKVG